MKDKISAIEPITRIVELPAESRNRPRIPISKREKSEEDFKKELDKEIQQLINGENNGKA